MSDGSPVGVASPTPPAPLPTLRFRLPGDWWAVSLSDRDAALASAKRLVRHRVGAQDERAALRARLLRDFGLAIDEATGHYRLQFAVADFRDAWSVRREQLTDEITAVREAVVAIHDTFQALDAELAQRVTAFTSTEESAQ